jgi:hypothetical protein
VASHTLSRAAIRRLPGGDWFSIGALATGSQLRIDWLFALHTK